MTWKNIVRTLGQGEVSYNMNNLYRERLGNWTSFWSTKGSCNLVKRQAIMADFHVASWERTAIQPYRTSSSKSTIRVEKWATDSLLTKKKSKHPINIRRGTHHQQVDWPKLKT